MIVTLGKLALLAAAALGMDSKPGELHATGGFIGISVASAEKSAEWYGRVLGLKVVLRPPASATSRMIALEGDGMLVELVEEKAAVPLSVAAPAVTRDYLVHGVFKGGFVVGDWDAAVARLKAQGVPIAIGPFPARKDQRANLMIRDPDGNFIQLFGNYASD